MSLLALVLTGMASGNVSPEEEDPQQVFEQGLEEVQLLLDRERWGQARESLLRLLEEAPQEDWVLWRWAAIEDALAKSTFYADYEWPEAEDVVSGELISWNAKTGKIKLRYRKGDRGLSISTGPRSGEEEEEGEPRRVGDFNFTDGDTTLLHPLVFTGPYHIEVDGGLSHYRGFGSDVPLVLVAWNWSSLQGLLYGECYGVLFAGWTVLFELKNAVPTVLESSLKEVEGSIKVSVAKTSISVYSGRKKLIRAKRPKGEWGQFGLSNFDLDTIEEILITGEVEASWITGLLDERIHEDWDRFLERFDAEEHLPEWMAARLEGEVVTAEDFGEVWPGGTEGQKKNVLNKLSKLYDEGDLKEGLSYFEGLEEGEVSPASRAWTRAHFSLMNGDVPQAIEACNAVRQEVPDFYEAALLRARLLALDDSSDEGLFALEEVVLDFPEYVDTYEELAMLHLTEGRMEEAEAVLAVGIGNGIPPSGLETIGRTLERSAHGPRWAKASTHVSPNFIVTSDLDEKACYEIAEELEKFYKKYINRVRRPADSSQERFRVYFFSGHSGYLAYTEDILGQASESTWGLYSPWLKQLVLWNSPDKRKVIETVRHEGFHQYFHRITSHEPRWLNEGLALYFMQARLVDGSWKDDQIQVEYASLLQALDRDDWTPLEELVYGDARSFMSRASLHYPQAWAFVHYLYSERDLKKRLDVLLDALQEGSSRKEAVQSAFAGVDWLEMERDFTQHVLDMETD